MISRPTLPPPRTSPPTELFDGSGFRFGTYDGAVRDPDLLARWGGPARRWHASRCKEWQAFQLFDDGWFVLGAVYDAKLLGLVQIVAVDTANGCVHRFERKVPTFRVDVATGLDGTRSQGRAGGLSVSVENDLGVGRLRVHATATAGVAPTGGPMELIVTADPGAAGHLVICHPFPDGTPLYSHKSIMGAAGSLRIGEDVVAFEPGRAVLALDDHKGHYPSPMQYDWVTAGGRDDAGRVVGFNLTANQIRDPATYNENALWIGADVHRLPPVRVDRPRGVHAPWRINDAAGSVDVTFEPVVRNEQHVGPRSWLADYYGPFGWFTGAIEVDGARLDADGMFGMGEQKFIRF